MGEHSKPEPEYNLHGYKAENLNSATPELDLQNRSTDEIRDLLARRRDRSAEVYDDEDAWRQDNQLAWELKLLGDTHPDLLVDLIDELQKSDDEFERSDAVALIPSVFKNGIETALFFTDRVLGDEIEAVSEHAPDMLDDAVMRGRIEINQAGSLVAHLAEKLIEANRRIAELENAEHTIGREAAKRGVHLSGSGGMTHLTIGEHAHQTIHIDNR